MCIICNKKFYTINECREQFNFKQNRDQLDEKKNNRNDKRRRENDNDNDEKHYANVNNENDEHKIYIIINLNILTIISVMFYEIVY